MTDGGPCRGFCAVAPPALSFRIMHPFLRQSPTDHPSGRSFRRRPGAPDAPRVALAARRPWCWRSMALAGSMKLPWMRSPMPARWVTRLCRQRRRATVRPSDALPEPVAARKVQWVLQKARRSACDGFVPVITRRSLVRDVEDVTSENPAAGDALSRKQPSSVAAASCRRWLPHRNWPRPRCARRHHSDRLGGKAIPVRNALDGREAVRDVILFIVPEGGYEPDGYWPPIAGAVPVSLGRILRTESRRRRRSARAPRMGTIGTLSGRWLYG